LNFHIVWLILEMLNYSLRRLVRKLVLPLKWKGLLDKVLALYGNSLRSNNDLSQKMPNLFRHDAIVLAAVSYTGQNFNSFDTNYRFQF
jgi:hypothetical protein